MLNGGNVLAWDIAVTPMVEVHYTPDDTFSPPAWLCVRGADPIVPTSPDGGQIYFHGSFIVGWQGDAGPVAVTLAGFAPGARVAFVQSGITHKLDGLTTDALGRLVVATAVPQPLPGA